jgi:uncharacterized membrane protein YeaQ/YmgE (transglycosylase-associated protein family)
MAFLSIVLGIICSLMAGSIVANWIVRSIDESECVHLVMYSICSLALFVNATTDLLHL